MKLERRDEITGDRVGTVAHGLYRSNKKIDVYRSMTLLLGFQRFGFMSDLGSNVSVLKGWSESRGCAEPRKTTAEKAAETFHCLAISHQPTKLGQATTLHSILRPFNLLQSP